MSESSKYEQVLREMAGLYERMNEMALNLANLQAMVTKLEADVPARIAAGTAAADAANQATVDAMTASLTNLDNAVTNVTGQSTATATPAS